MAIDEQTFKAVMGQFAAGVTIVTVANGEELHGMTATAFSSLSKEPPLLLVCVDKRARSHELIQNAGSFAVNILSGAQDEVSNRFAGFLGPEARHFNDLPHKLGDISGAPLLNDAIAWMDCKLAHAYDGGDHTIFVGEIMTAAATEERPLVYYKGKYHTL